MGVFGNSKTRLNCENVSRTMAGAGVVDFQTKKLLWEGYTRIFCINSLSTDPLFCLEITCENARGGAEKRQKLILILVFLFTSQ